MQRYLPIIKGVDYSYGVMQGRLSKPEPDHFQAFPRNSWRDEFPLAKVVGFSYIEWIHDRYDAGINPIFTRDGLAEIAKLKRRFNIDTPALCCDWLMDFPLVRCSDAERTQRERHLRELFPLVQQMGARRIVLPFVDNARLVTDEEKESMIALLRNVLPLAEHHQVEIHLETDLDPLSFSTLLDQLPYAAIKVNWDSGNSSGSGYIAREEFAAYGDRIGSIHIKDRLRNPDGSVETRPLGEGSADFDDVFQAIRSVGFSGGLTLQVARGIPGEEVNFLQSQIDFLNRFAKVS